MSEEFLNINQTPKELSGLYGAKDYYWYLRSSQFGEAFLKPLAELVMRYGTSCLDVGCGEGQLYEWLHPESEYRGIDGSNTAIERGLKKNRPIGIGRFEEPQKWSKWDEEYDVVVFGGVLEVLIKPQFRVDFLKMYKRFGCSHFIIYDLDRLDTSLIEKEFKLIELKHTILAAPDMKLVDAKYRRKIWVFECR